MSFVNIWRETIFWIHAAKNLFSGRLFAISLRYTPCGDGSSFVEDARNCPLSFLGCSFRAQSLEVPFGRSLHRSHTRTHDLVERAKGFQAMREVGYGLYEIDQGIATCPVCQELVCNQDDYIWKFINHLSDHSKEERKPHILGLWKRLCLFTQRHQMFGFHQIRNEYRNL